MNSLNKDLDLPPANFSSPAYEFAFQIANALRGHGFLKHHAGTPDVANVISTCLDKLAAPAVHKAEEPWDIVHQRLAVKGAALKASREATKTARARREALRKDAENEDRAFRMAARNTLDVLDFMALVDLSKEIVAENLKNLPPVVR